MVMAKQQHGKGLPKQARNEPAPPAPQPAPFRFEQCWRCDDANRQADDGSTNGAAGPAGPLHLTLGPLGPAAADRCRCSCGVAPAPAAPATVAVLRGSRYLRPAQELLGEVVRVADLAAGEDEDEDQAAERLEGGGGHRAVRAAGGNDGDGDGVEAKLLGLLSELESRRERYFGELGRVVSTFEPALGDGTAAAYTSLMARAMARHFGNLRRAILRRLRLHAAAAARRSLTLRRGGAEDRDDDDDEEEAEVTEELVERVARRTKLAAAARAEQASWRPLRGRAPGLALRPFPPPVPRRRREAEAGGDHRPKQAADIQLVHQRARAAVEAHDRGDVQGRVLRGFRRLQGRRRRHRLLVFLISSPSTGDQRLSS